MALFEKKWPFQSFNATTQDSWIMNSGPRESWIQGQPRLCTEAIKSKDYPLISVCIRIPQTHLFFPLLRKSTGMWVSITLWKAKFAHIWPIKRDHLHWYHLSYLRFKLTHISEISCFSLVQSGMFQVVLFLTPLSLWKFSVFMQQEQQDSNGAKWPLIWAGEKFTCQDLHG